jgi:hypothetical protein
MIGFSMTTWLMMACFSREILPGDPEHCVNLLGYSGRAKFTLMPPLNYMNFYRIKDKVLEV